MKAFRDGLLGASFVAGLALLGAPALAANLIVSAGGKLVGATGVAVNGVSYDVQFADGTCAQVFSGCDSTDDFAFSDEATALAAGQALLDQVLIDSSSGMFDSVPTLTFGCSFDPMCQSLIPVFFEGINVRGAVVNNNSVGEDLIFYGGGANINLNTADFPAVNYAVFTPSAAPVPEPASWIMLIAGFGTVGYSLRRRRIGYVLASVR